MAIGAWNEDELREFVRRELRDSDLDRLVRQLQGGPRSLFNEVVTQDTTSSQTYVDLANVGPQVTFPFAGLWLVGWGATIEGAAQNRGLASMDGTDANAVSAAMGNPGAQSQGGSVARVRRLTVTSGQVIKLVYRNAIAAAVTYEKRWIAAIPVGP